MTWLQLLWMFLPGGKSTVRHGHDAAGRESAALACTHAMWPCRRRRVAGVHRTKVSMDINKQLARFSSMGSLTRLAWRTRNSVRIVYNDKWRSESGSYPTPATSENSRVTAKTSHPQSRESTHTATARVAHDRQPVERRTTAIRYGCCVLSHLFAALSPLAVWWDRAT